MKGPRVSGPWLEYWGSNAIALNRPTLYTHSFPLILPCGTMFPQVFNLQDTWWHRRRWIHVHQSKHVDTMDLESTRSSITTPALKTHLSEVIEGSPWTTWGQQMDVVHRNFGASWVDAWKHRDAPIKDRTT